jgi:hypothetical protein
LPRHVALRARDGAPQHTQSQFAVRVRVRRRSRCAFAVASVSIYLEAFYRMTTATVRGLASANTEAPHLQLTAVGNVTISGAGAADLPAVGKQIR